MDLHEQCVCVPFLLCCVLNKSTGLSTQRILVSGKRVDLGWFVMGLKSCRGEVLLQQSTGQAKQCWVQTRLSRKVGFGRSDVVPNTEVLFLTH